ncbi:MAG: homocysteine S-methyltransferase family protein [Verrucomicrobiota bacterium]|nr:homocysteine S-methyltransferase family protein [Verrucomicrobiota bacterium]
MSNALPLWSVKIMFDQPDIVTKNHRGFLMSGARVICLNTYALPKSRMTRHGFCDQ